MAVNDANSRFTSGELKFASWWVQHGIQMRRFGHGILIGISAILWGYVLWSLLDAYAISYPRESRINLQIAINQQLLTALETDRPQDVSLSDVSVTQTTDNRFDMEVEALNPNEQWWADFNYHFSLSGEQTPIRNGYVLPGSKQIITELGYKPAAKGGRSASLIVENIRWHRVDPSVVGASYKDFAASRKNFEFQDIKYDTGITLGTRKVGQTSFMLVNNAAYGFWSVDLVVHLYRGGAPIAVNIINVTKILPNERRLIQTVWLDNLPDIAKTEIIPQMNLLDQKAYLPTQYF
jgi:hypothetical protein